MVDSRRRNFLIGAALAATSSITAVSLRARAGRSMRSSNVLDDLRPLIDRERKNILVAMAKEDIPGVAVCLIYNGRPAWIEGFGVTDRRSGRMVDDDTIFSIQSTSKNFTATAVLIAVQRGLLDLDEPITTYLPGFTVQSRFETAPAKNITLRLLLSHRAGFTHEAPIGNNADASFRDFAAHVASISRTWLRFPVGERYRYSNLGVDLAGYILQTVSKMSFPSCLRTMIFDPLRMTDTTAATEVYIRRGDRAVGHEAGYTTVPLRIPLIPSGGVYTSARDMAAYLMFHLNKGRLGSNTILEEKSWEEMHHFPPGGDYGLGVARFDLHYGDTPVRLLSHNGGGFGFGCRLNYVPEAKLGWAVLFNRPVLAGYQFGGELLHNILFRRYGSLRTSAPAQDSLTIKPEKEQLAQFVGSYVGRARSVDMKIIDGRLAIQTEAQSTPVEFTSPVDVSIPGPAGNLVSCHYFAASDRETAHFECSIGDLSVDYNDGPHDAPGPNNAAWDLLLGDYLIYQWCKPSQQLTVHRKNGYLYLNETRLIVEFEPGLFFTTDGEAVDFRPAVPTWRNIALKRTTIDPSK
jgi:CubicO group peptidase (beta-lactamase class C family)